ncbi:MAG TPA: hypothetical protein VL442_11690 [Mucilaginibacter sp.]|jgi:hypothetical protein|nr:hypothetical protein [Mucilaginibacter sp.]
MSHLFQLHPNLRTLQRYKYINAPEDQLEYAIQNGHGESVELDFIPGNVAKEEFIELFLNVLEKYELMDYAETLLYICLREALEYDTVINHAYDTYNSEKRAEQLAQLLLCFEETTPQQLLTLKLSTLKQTVKITDNNLITWIGGLIKAGFENGKFSYGQLGEGVWHLLEPGPNGLKFPSTLNYDRIKSIANKTVRSPTLIHKKQIAYRLHNIWQFINCETTLTSDQDVRYSDKQLNCLFEIAQVLGWLHVDAINSPPKDYMYALFTNYIRV